jgi:hypothetical protein
VVIMIHMLVLPIGRNFLGFARKCETFANFRRGAPLRVRED